MADALFTKRFGSLRPADALAGEAIAKIKDGETIRVEWKRPRNLRMHRLYWSLCQLVAENTQGYTADNISDLIKLSTGHYDVLKTASGKKIYHVPRSISFSLMDQDAFKAFFDRAIDFILAHVLPNTNRPELEREVFERIGIPLEAA
jgi:hypothetical protein